MSISIAMDADAQGQWMMELIADGDEEALMFDAFMNSAPPGG